MLTIYDFNFTFFLYRGPRSRKRTISARTRDEEPKIVDREILDPKSDNNDQDENYDEFDLLAEMKDRSTRRVRTTSESGPRYLRSLSENAPHTPIGKHTFSFNMTFKTQLTLHFFRH